MNELDANVLLTKAALLDPRMKRRDEIEQADMATAWADVLHDVDLHDALTALEAHYRVSREPIMPADVLERTGWEPPSPHENVTQRVAEQQLRRALDDAGVTRAEFDAAVARRDSAWLRSNLSSLFPDDRPGALEQ